MDEIIAPKIKFNELDYDTRKIMLTIIRWFVNMNPKLKQEVGIDCAEETVMMLFDKGILKIRLDEDENVHIGFYDFNRLEYIFPSMGEEWKL